MRDDENASPASSRLSAASPARLGALPRPATLLGLGGGPLGGLFRPVAEDEAEAAVERAWDLGIRYFDVAPLYGHGRSERVVGRVLQGKPRDEFVLSTKVGRLLRPDAAGQASDFVDVGGLGPVFDFSADGVTRSLAESLERLGLDRVDVALLHDPEQHLDQALTKAIPALARLRAEGVVRAIGVGTNSTTTLVRFAREAEIDCALLANRYTLLDRSAETEALPLCAERGIAVVAGGVFNSGLLADPDAVGATYDYRPATDDLRCRARQLARVCAEHGVALASAAMRFPLRSAVVVAVVVGARSADEVEANVEAFDAAIPPELWEALAA